MKKTFDSTAALSNSNQLSIWIWPSTASTKTRRYSALALATLAAVALQLSASRAHAYYSLLETGELLKPEEYQVSAEVQEGSAGGNVLFHLASGIDKNLASDSNAKATVGFGEVNFLLGGGYKWVPFPDTATQPAIGAEFGALYAHNRLNNEFTLSFSPLASKVFQTEIGDVTPYASLPIGLAFHPDDTVVPVQLVGGAEVKPLNTPDWSFLAELGINISEAYGHFSIAAAYHFDQSDIPARKNAPTR